MTHTLRLCEYSSANPCTLWKSTPCRGYSDTARIQFLRIKWLDGECPTQKLLPTPGDGYSGCVELHGTTPPAARSPVLPLEGDTGLVALKADIVLHSMKQEVLSLTRDQHIGGHWSRDKMYATVINSFFWPYMHMDCRLVVETRAVGHVSDGPLP